MPTLAVVVPAYNESEGLREFQRRLGLVFDSLDLDCSVLYVDDGSRDDTWQVMESLRDTDRRVATLRLSRNFGKELALTAGLDHVDADAVVVIDADLQDQPELISQFVARWREGYDVVYGTRSNRAGETALKKFTSAAFYRVMEKMTDLPVPRDTGDFRLMSRRVVDALKLLRERQRFMKGLFTWVGFRQTSVVYDRDARFAGDSKWNYWKLWNFALEGITSFSSFPLRVATYVGFAAALAAFIFGMTVFFKALVYGDPVRGYPSLMVAILFLGGMQLMALGMIGEYLGRTYVESKQRPLYFVDSHHAAAVASSAQKKPVSV
jgi:polyisoprenyl-phosphate glycosyltransferase